MIVLALALAGCATASPAPGSPPRNDVEALLARVQVIAKRPFPGGYQRSCKPGDGCVFGAAWSDATTAPDSHNGCDTRNDVLREQLKKVTFKPGTHDCLVTSGTLEDPYSGETVAFTKAKSGDVQIDHVYPLAAAWDFGAAAWPMPKRMQFANDTKFNLLAVKGDENQAKGDSTPSKWLPEAAYRCFYAAKYLTVAIQYGLPIGAEDHTTLKRVAATCS